MTPENAVPPEVGHFGSINGKVRIPGLKSSACGIGYPSSVSLVDVGDVLPMKVGVIRNTKSKVQSE